MARSFWKDHTDSDMLVLKQLLRLPLWQVPGPEAGAGYSLASIQAYIWSLSGRSQPPASAPASVERGYLVLDYHWQVWTYLLTVYISTIIFITWQARMGDLSFNEASFPSLSQLQEAVSEAGLRLALTINPFVSVESENFREGEL